MTQGSTEALDRAASVEAALEVILRSVDRMPAEEVALLEAAGRVLASPIVAREDLWPFARAAMDGVAVRSADLAGASPAAPVLLRAVGALYPGQTWEAPLEPGTAVRIATGAPVPPGADAVVPHEGLEWRGDLVVIRHAAAARRHIFPAGEDARAGEVVLEAGTVLRGGHLALLAALGAETVRVVRRPEVAILACGDELVGPGSCVRPGQVRESNSFFLAAEVSELGARPRLLGIAADNVASLDAKIQDGLRADALIVSGGLSVGERDLVRDALRRAGVALQFRGVPMKPGSPAAFGTAGRRPVFGLPGTPSAARITFEVLARPALCVMAGRRDIWRPAVMGRLTSPLAVTPGRRRYLWGRVCLGPSGLEVSPLSVQGTAALRSASDATALIEVQAGDEALPAGTPVRVHLLTAGDLITREGRLPRVLGIAGGRGAGKTTLLERLVAALRRRGVRVAVVKHHAHMDGGDVEGTDTWRAARAGAHATVLAGPGAAVYRFPGGEDAPLAQVLAGLGPVDLVLVEGYGGTALPRILVRRRGVAADRPDPAGPLIAVVEDEPPSAVAPGEPGHAGSAAAAGSRPIHLGWDDVDRLAEVILERLLPSRA